MCWFEGYNKGARWGVWLCALVICLFPAVPVAAQSSGPSIILFIGDGMGEAHRAAARWVSRGISGTLAMDAVPFSGWARTASENASVTDSAAAATALATGFKTRNGVISQVYRDGAWMDVETILELAQRQGMVVGLVTTTPVAHATPAAFAAHVRSRAMVLEIARQMLARCVNVILGGGEDDFLPVGVSGCYPGFGKRDDGRNLIAEAMSTGYTYMCDADALRALEATSSTRVLGLFADAGMVRPFTPTLAMMTETAIDILAQHEGGFFLMVEGGQIDWAAHNNDTVHTIADTLDLDAAVAVAQVYATTRLNTLIIVTADHETGGMGVSRDAGAARVEPFRMPDGTPFYVTWSTKQHTPADVPVTAIGPGAGLLQGEYENTHIYQVMALALTPQSLYLPVRLRAFSSLD